MDHIQILNLKTEYQKNPCGIDIKNPAFSWQMKSERYGAAQCAYRVLVWEWLEEKNPVKAAELESKTISFVWDSEKVKSTQSVAVCYQGEELLPRKRYSWCVIVWDEQGEAVESEWNWFETGLMGTGKNNWNGA